MTCRTENIIQFWIIREVLIFKDIGQSRRRGVNPSQPAFSSTHRHGLTLWCAGNIEDQLHFFLDKPAGSSSNHFFFLLILHAFNKWGLQKIQNRIEKFRIQNLPLRVLSSVLVCQSYEVEVYDMLWHGTPVKPYEIPSKVDWHWHLLKRRARAALLVIASESYDSDFLFYIGMNSMLMNAGLRLVVPTSSILVSRRLISKSIIIKGNHYVWV